MPLEMAMTLFRLIASLIILSPVRYDILDPCGNSLVIKTELDFHAVLSSLDFEYAGIGAGIFEGGVNAAYEYLENLEF